MRTLLRAGAIALAASTTLLGGAVAAQAAPTGAVTVNVNRLILDPARSGGHTGSIRIVIRNTTNEPTAETIAITEPMPSTIGEIVGADGCVFDWTADHRTIYYCHLGSIAPGGTGVVTATLRSPAKPQPYAQVALQRGGVEFGGVTAEFDTVFRSTTGSLRNPQPYVQDTTAALTVTAGDVTLTRQRDGSYAGRVPVTIRNNGDAPHDWLRAELAAPDLVDTFVDLCFEPSASPVPPAREGIDCEVWGGPLAEGKQRTFHWLFTAPAGTPVGSLGTGTTLVKLGSRAAAAQTDGANIDSFNVTVAR